MVLQFNRLCAFLALPLVLAACSGEDVPEVEIGEGGGSGEVLEGTISDEMIPLDEVQSRAPRIAPTRRPANGGGDTGEAEPADEIEETQADDAVLQAQMPSAASSPRLSAPATATTGTPANSPAASPSTARPSVEGAGLPPSPAQ